MPSHFLLPCLYFSYHTTGGAYSTMIDQESISFLEEIAGIMVGEQYEPGGLFTIGGTAGTYQIKSPYNTECEFSIISLSASVATGASFAISSSNPTVTAPTITTQYGLASLGTEQGNPYEGVAGFCTSSSQNAYANIWLPLGRGALIYVNVAPTASNVVYATLAFRRSLYKYIPNAPRMAPSTHTRPASRRPMRMMYALSKQVAGFEQQYSGGKYGEYEHEPIPESQDLKSTVTPSHTSRNSGRGR